MTRPLGRPDPRVGVFRRDTGIGFDAAQFPWVSRCPIVKCNWAISSKSEGGAVVRLSAHQAGEYGPCPFNAVETGASHGKA